MMGRGNIRLGRGMGAGLMDRAGNARFLPYVVDFSTLPDGPLPASFTAPAWSVSGGKAVCSQTLGPNLVTDSGLEANYTDGKCDSFDIKTGSPILAQSADVHGGSKAQQFTAVAANNSLRVPMPQLPAGWYHFGCWSKKVAGSGYLAGYWAQGPVTLPSAEQVSFSDGDWAYDFGSILQTSFDWLDLVPLRQLSGASFPTVNIDDVDMRAITSNPYALLKPTQADVTVTIPVPGAYADFADSSHLGIVVRASDADLTNAIIVLYRRRTQYLTGLVGVLKKIGSNYSVMIIENNVYPAPGNNLEVRVEGDQLSVFHNSVQYGTTQTITDPELLTGKIHGLISLGGHTFSRVSFFPTGLTEYHVGGFGSSITAPSAGWAADTVGLVQTGTPEFRVMFSNQARGGNWPWSNLVRYDQELKTKQPVDMVLADARLVTAVDYPALEALIRRIWTDNPKTIIISPIIPADSNDDGVIDDLTQTNLDDAVLAAQYGIHTVDYRQHVIDRVAAGDPLSLYMQDTIHPTPYGAAVCAQLVWEAITANNWMTPENHAVLPGRLWDNGDYENEPTRKAGTANDGTTGTWTTSGARIQSSEAGATVTFSATCKSFGLYDATTGYATPYVDYQVDGGAWALNQLVNQNGVAIAAGRGAHTIVIRVRAGTTLTIDEFWAV